MRFLMSWIGVTSGSHLGRDDGYPERRFREINSLDDLIAVYDPKAEFYRVDRIENNTIEQFIKLSAAMEK